MKITWKHGGRTIEFERQPMPQERFTALCKLAGGVIGGAVLLALVRMLDVWGLVWTIGALVLVEFYKAFKNGFWVQ